ncbi:MAG: C39 family peptidase [Parcubacteria group bacterium]|nr:C39 family peptidase [Parcubacteria group bacterium]
MKEFLRKHKTFFGIIAVLLIVAGIIFYITLSKGEPFEYDSTSQRYDSQCEIPEDQEKVLEIEEISDIQIKQDIATKAENYLLNIPFICQAPFAEWDNSIFQDGCEEAASLMAVYWALNKELDKNIAQEKIIAMADYQKKKFGQAEDTSAQDTTERLIKGYFEYSNAEVRRNINIHDIIEEIKKGNAVIVPANGQLLGNPYFTQPGPEKHNLIIRGYDENKQEFITNDPGTRRGEEYRYNQDVLYNAIRDYPTGYHELIERIEKVMIVVWK